MTLVDIITAWAVVTGVLEIVAAVRLRRQLAGEWWLVLSGVLSVVFGVLVMLALAFRLRRARAELRELPFARAA